MTDRITIICSDPRHPVNAWLERWSAAESHRAQIEIVRDVADAHGGDFLYLISCHQIVRAATRSRYAFTLVLHASDLPQGRGMSPHVWQVIEGKNRFPLTWLNAEDGVDTGAIWQQEWVVLEGHELFDEIHAKLFDAELRLMSWALDNCRTHNPRAQSGEPSFYRRRTPEDSRIDASAPLLAAFNQLRIADPDRYPAFFEHAGHRYKIRIEKISQ
ncbi:MAG: formyltransferase family protein [Beijerinckiaceae bacterium]